MEQQAKETLKNIVFRCPSQRGKKNTLDYSYRALPGALNLKEIAVDNLLIPTVRLRTSENKKAYHRFDKLQWLEISNTTSAALISPQNGEMLFHAPHETLGQLAPPKTPTPAPAIASSSRRRSSSVSSSVDLTTPLTSIIRKSGSEVLAKLTGSSPPAQPAWLQKILSQDPLKISQSTVNRSSMVKEISESPKTRDQPMEQRVNFAQATRVEINPSPSVSSKSRSPTHSISSLEEEAAVASRGSPRPTSLPLHNIARPEKNALEHLCDALVEEELPELNWISLIQPTDPPVEYLFDPRLIQIGRTMADMHNVRAAKLRHINELADGRPPITPLPKAFQCPLMARLASTDLVATLNTLMLDCGVAMSRALIKAEETLENELRRELLNHQGDILPSHAESHVIKIISEARERNQQVYRPKIDPLIYYDVTGVGNLARITPHESAMKANTSNSKIPGNQGANTPKVDNKGLQPKNTPAKPSNKSKGKSLAPPNKNQGKGPAPRKAPPILRGDQNFIETEQVVTVPASTSVLPDQNKPIIPEPQKSQQTESVPKQAGPAKQSGKQGKKGGKNPPKNQQRSKKAGAGRSNWNQRPAPYQPLPLMEQRPFSGPPTWMPPPMQGYDQYRPEYAPRQSPYYDERDGYSQYGRERRDYYRT